MNSSILRTDWEIFYKVLNESIQREDIDESYRILEKICTFGYSYNFLPNFSDNQLELKLYELTKLIASKHQFTSEKKEKTKRVIFYDHITADFRGFTQKYLEYFFDNDIEFLYVMHTINYNENSEIIKAIKKYPKGSIYCIQTKNTSPSLAIKDVFDVISDYNGSKIFIHNTPADILSYCLCILLKPIETKSFLLNIGDHAFWLGGTIFDYIINFRNYGVQLDHYYRGIPLDKILKINTLAYIDETVTFQGFPISTKNKIIGFGGGGIFKIQDESNTYLNLIKDLLLQNENFIFFFANVNDKTYVSNFIKENNLEGRLIPIGDRHDICEIFDNIDIYFNTYPYGGGNMVSIAFQKKIPVVAMYNEKYPFTRIDIVYDIEVENKYIPKTKEEFNAFANNLIRFPVIRNEVAELFYNKINAKKSFNEGLRSLLNDDLKEISINSIANIQIDNEPIIEFHLSTNQFSPINYYYLKSSILNHHFILQLKDGYKSKAYWKTGFIISIKKSSLAYFPSLNKLKMFIKNF
jgi:hypothetical protein